MWPPGIISGNVKVISNVVESVGLDVVNVIDEPTAAASVLGITDGAVVDVGGGGMQITIYACLLPQMSLQVEHT